MLGGQAFLVAGENFNLVISPVAVETAAPDPYRRWPG
jgi:hypothetical protein